MDKRPPKYLTKAAALAKIQRYCAYQDRCHQEVRAKLLEWQVYGDTLEEIMAELIADRFLDEARFARSFARGKWRIKQWGRVRITLELKQRQISAYCIREALAEIDETEYRTQLAQLLSQQREALPPGAEPWAARQKLFAFAQRKGYESELILEYLDRQE